MELLDICDCIITLKEKIPDRLTMTVENYEGTYTTILLRESNSVLVEATGDENKIENAHGAALVD